MVGMASFPNKATKHTYHLKMCRLAEKVEYESIKSHALTPNVVKRQRAIKIVTNERYLSRGMSIKLEEQRIVL